MHLALHRAPLDCCLCIIVRRRLHQLACAYWLVQLACACLFARGCTCVMTVLSCSVWLCGREPPRVWRSVLQPEAVATVCLIDPGYRAKPATPSITSAVQPPSISSLACLLAGQAMLAVYTHFTRIYPSNGSHTCIQTFSTM